MHNPHASQGSNNALSTESLRGSDAVSVRELADMRSAGREHTVLDVREARELDICRLEGALHIPMAEIPARTDVLPTNQPLVVICHHGARSQIVVDFLRNAGFDNAINLNGGIEGHLPSPTSYFRSQGATAGILRCTVSGWARSRYAVKSSTCS